jgi:hypothetical protein
VEFGCSLSRLRLLLCELELVADIRYPLVPTDTRQGVRMAVSPPPQPGGYPGISWDTRSQLPAGRVSFQPARSFQPLRHVPCQLEGFPSSRQGTYTLSTGGFPFMYLVNWKETLPAGNLILFSKKNLVD